MLEALSDALRSPVALLYAAALAGSGFLIGGEALWGWLRRPGLYGRADTLANAGMWLGYVLLNVLWAGVVFSAYSAAYERAPVRLSVGGWHVGLALWWEWLLLFVLDDLCFYGFHRASHRCRFLWASHVNHHSSRHFNLSVAFRQTWTPFFAFVFWLPLPLLGFDPLMVLSMQALSLFYQSLLHTQLVGPLGPLEWLLNTPTHHRVHHGSNPEYVDKNFGGVLIVWDRLFGTFAVERPEAPLRFGLHEDLESHNPLWIAAHEWVPLGRALAAPGSLRERLRRLL